MPILKFSQKNNTIVLDKLRMEDISEDRRTALFRDTLLSPIYKIDESVYMARNDLFFKMAKLFNTSRQIIDAMLVRYKNCFIVIVPTKSYVFWNGRCVSPEVYTILQTNENKRIQEEIVNESKNKS